jgi:undecaprenyl-diphosphatase
VPATLLAGFGLLLALIEAGVAVPHVDRVVRDWMFARHTAGVHTVFDRLTVVLQPATSMGLLGGVGVFAGWRQRSWRPVVLTLAVLAVLIAVVVGVKHAVHRPPPDLRTSSAGHGGDFPSGHTTAVLVCSVVAGRLLGWRPRWIALLAGGLTLLVGGALVYLIYHNVSDVVGALLIGGVLVWAADRWGFAAASGSS